MHFCMQLQYKLLNIYWNKTVSNRSTNKSHTYFLFNIPYPQVLLFLRMLQESDALQTFLYVYIHVTTVFDQNMLLLLFISKLTVNVLYVLLMQTPFCCSLQCKYNVFNIQLSSSSFTYIDNVLEKHRKGYQKQKTI